MAGIIESLDVKVMVLCEVFAEKTTVTDGEVRS